MIDVVVWMAAGPDCQFINPVASHLTDFQWPTEAHRQSDIHESFQSEFPSFLNGCSYLVDNHYCVSETAEYVTDIFKRYVTCAASYPLVYTPVAGSIQSYFLSAFKYRRGGVMYKIITNRTPTSQTTVPVSQTTSGSTAVQLGHGPAGASASFNSRGNAHFVQCSQEDVVDFTVPWNWVLPFMIDGKCSPSLGDPMFEDLWPGSSDGDATVLSTSPQTVYAYTAVRDDFLIGFLQPPVSLALSKPRVLVPERIRKAAGAALPRHKIGEFTAVPKQIPPLSGSKPKEPKSYFSLI